MASEVLQQPWASVRTTASHTIGIPHLFELLTAVSPGAPTVDYEHAVVEDNLLGRPTLAGRKRSFRHQKELYLLDPDRPEFVVFRTLWDLDPRSRPLLAGLLAFTRDELFRSSFVAVRDSVPGDVVGSDSLATAVRSRTTGLGDKTLAKIGRNTAASWTQTGHLRGRSAKQRLAVTATPAASAFAAALAHLSGARADQVLGSPWFEVLDLDANAAREAVDAAHRHGLLTVRSAGTVLEIDPSPLGVAL